jgi:ABC-type glycerol-3-phosphate transport system permease component
MYLLAIYMIPGVFLLLPLYLILKSLFLTNTHLGLILTHLTFALPFSIWMMKGYFDSLPVDMEESALVDGCSRVGAVVRIAMPLAAPGVAATALYCFVLSWQEYLFAVTIMASEEMRTLPVGVAAFMSWATLEWGPIMAFVTLMTIPTMIFFAYLQKFLIQGLTAGAIKG